MDMIPASAFLDPARRAGFTVFSGVPCSYLQPFINAVIDAPDLRYVGATNEGDAVAIASGASLGGVRGVAMFQNSGLGNAVSPLTSLNAIFSIPILLVTTLRGEPGGPHDEPQHALMGRITTSLLDLMEIPWELFPDDAAPALARATEHMDRTGKPYAFVMRKGTVAPHVLRSSPIPRPAPPPLAPFEWPAARPSRTDVLRVVQRAARSTDVLVATTGYTGRELYALEDRDGQLYMVGSMGCASSFALGLAIAQPSRRIVVLDGDGAALMRLGALATLGHERPPNVVHVILDNEVHDSTGGQATVSSTTDLAAVAQACGYPRVVRATTPDEVSAALDSPGLALVHVKIRPGAPKDLPRPTITPPEVARRLQRFLAR